MPGAPYNFLRPLLFALSPETAHSFAVCALRLRAQGGIVAPPQMPTTAMGIAFPNPVGLAAGFDKNADAADAFASLGFGFIESGAITPRAQAGNPPPRLFRLPQARALINRMGFNNCGMHKAENNLRQFHDRRFVLGINLGKNADTPPQNAATDYILCLEHLYMRADFFTINISSPNTPGLRDLQSPPELRKLLTAVVHCRDKLAAKNGSRKPLAIKLSPDMNDDELSAIAEIVVELNVDGVVACNTTIARAPEIAGLRYATEKGGLSGAPLTARALAITRQLRELLPPEISIIGVGGIMSAQDAQERMQAGADLVQVYTGLIYQGPSLPQNILRKLRGAN